jgi:hypothetical protein
VQLTARDAPGSGIAVDIPNAATGTVRVPLDQVDILENAGHGVLVDDQDDPSTGTLDGDSNASVDVQVDQCQFIQNGFSASDRDGLRVNEGGNGDLLITFRNSSSLGNGADGIEVDEKGAGDVVVALFNSHLDGNGQKDPADLDDGFDIDEADAGSVIGLISHTTANDNFEQGFDFNENHTGDLRVDFDHCTANGNNQEGLELEEDHDFPGGGDIVTTMNHVPASTPNSRRRAPARCSCRR